MSSVVADRVGRRPLLIYSFFGTCVCHFIAGGYFFAQEILKTDHSTLTKYAWVPFVGIVGSSIVSTLGFGSIIFVIPGEIFPLNIKAVAMSSLSIFGGILGFIGSKGYQEIKDLAGLCGVFWIYASVAFIGAVFSYMFVPETKGKSLKEIQVMLQGDLYDDDSGKLDDVKTDVGKDNELQELSKKEITHL